MSKDLEKMQIMFTELEKVINGKKWYKIQYAANTLDEIYLDAKAEVAKGGRRSAVVPQEDIREVI